ncbi:MAG: 2-dehydropantoate 2-reductase [Deltaproteobacteria bacterium]|nr:2-dehydropantoate 2-reductase [Deltaproteobacteria bacterium]
MSNTHMAVVGIGATGAVLAAALLKQRLDTVLVASSEAKAQTLKENGLRVGGFLNYQVPVTRAKGGVAKLADDPPGTIILATKTFHLPKVLDELAGVFQPGMKIVSAHNGLGTEDLIAERFGPQAALRMSLNYGVGFEAPGQVQVAFFNRPNHLGVVDPAGEAAGRELAEALTQGGLDTELVPDIKLFIWKKMIMKCTMANICAVTDRTIRACLDDPPTRRIADACFQEILGVAKAKGYDLGPDYLDQVMGYLDKVGAHKDSMCVDLANRQPTEIEFLGGKVCEYAAEEGLEVPHYQVMTDLVRALENNYLKA